ncbi:metal dependent phosphohydrolase [Ferroglobus placidus DSM 10642]|uniref:Metal dependent phosphohydrolase n=1 Tax=Ferroglobus placidus (strain DSM 10642 / AEDII12DO) TaxID=589924 RepID=D3S1Q7_FERPA|nr:HD domain-containing protein [Ferroglobus placidus]ADC64364.1 metal dependent phosphohydrolase [Ferroglobus placidus DSM 10642]
MKIVQDTIHGTIKLEEWQLEIIDTAAFQRLRRIKQLGFANLVYPGANHTRFEHSLGAMHLARKLVEDEEVVAAALLHDIGHTPFSHSGEKVIERYARRRHEDVKGIIKENFEEILDKYGIDVKKVVKKIKESPVSGDIDVDRMDYLVRDSYYTGVAYGVFDVQRLIEKMYFDGKRLVIEEGGIRAAESMLVSRFMMYSAVYYHHVCRIAKKMFEKALVWMIENDMLSIEELQKMDDYDVVALMRRSERFPKFVIQSLDRRDLFKRAVYVSLDKVGVNLKKVKPWRAEQIIAEECGIDENFVIVDIPEERSEEYGALVEMEGEVRRLDEVSKIVQTLKSLQSELLKFGVYTKKEYVDKVQKAAYDIFNIEKTRQKKLF